MIEGAVGFVGTTLDAMAAVSPWLLGLAVLLHLLKVGAEGRAWHRIVAHAHSPSPVGFGTTLGAFVGSIGANAFLPARVGEAFRVGVVRRRVPGSSVATIAATIVLETILESVFAITVLVVLVVGGHSIGTLAVPGSRVLSDPLALGLGGALLVLTTTLALAFRRRAVSLARRTARGFDVVRAPRAFGAVCGWKLTAWTLRIASVFVFLVAFHVHATLRGALVVIGAQSLAGVIPVLPGNAGTQQAAFAVVLAGSASGATILGFGVGMQASTMLADVVVGGAAVLLLAGRGSLRGLIPVRRTRRYARASAV